VVKFASFHFDLREEYALEDGVLTGHPHWRLFQTASWRRGIFGPSTRTGWQTSTVYKATFILLLSLF